MEKIICNETRFFILCIFSGFIFLLSYDVFRIIRRLIKHSDFFVAIEDIVYGILIGLQIFLLNHENNNGVVRIFMFLGLLIGCIIYHKMFSTTVVSGVGGIICIFVDKIVKMLIIFQNFTKNVNKIWKRSKKIRKN